MYRKIFYTTSKIFLFLTVMMSNNVLGGDITLAWNASPSIGIEGYKIYCNKLTSPVDGKYVTECGRVSSNILSYKVNNLENGQRYYFVATAYKGLEESAYSNEVNGLANGQILKASFSVSKSSGVEPLTVTFTNTSTGDITSREWDLGNGAILSGDVVSTSYSYGTWAPKLTVGDGISFDSYSSNIIVSKAEAPIVVDFMGDKLSGVEPLTVTFTDLSTGGVLSRVWNFGDGSSSGDMNPVHVYSAGVYNVTLTVNGSISQVKNGYINVSKVIPPVEPPVQGINGMVMGYGFEEISGDSIIDMSGNRNTGTRYQASRVNGKYGRGIKFDGVNDIINVKDSNSLDLVNGMSLMAWVKPSEVNSLGDSIIVKENGGNSAYYLYSAEDSVNPLGGFYSNGYKSVRSGSIVGNGKWSHLAVTYDGNKLVMYINGVVDKVQNVTGNIVVSGGQLSIGGNKIWGEYFNGLMDEVRVYNRALSVDEINVVMGKGLSETNPAILKVGEEVIGDSNDYNEQGVAEASVFIAKEDGMVNEINVYLDGGTKVLGAIYSDLNGHPNSRLANGGLNVIKGGAWNRIPISSISIKKGVKYWIALLSTSGRVTFKTINNGGMMEIYSGNLTTLPQKWVTGNVYSNGPMSINGKGW